MSHIPSKTELLKKKLPKTNIPSKVSLMKAETVAPQKVSAFKPEEGKFIAPQLPQNIPVQQPQERLTYTGPSLQEVGRGIWETTKRGLGTITGGISAAVGTAATALPRIITGRAGEIPQATRQQYQFGKGIGEAPFEIAEEVKKTIIDYTSGDKNRIFNRIVEGYKRSADLGIYVIGGKPITIKEAKDIVLKDNLAAVVGIANNLWDAYLVARPTAGVIEKGVEKLPYPKVEPTGNKVIIPAETAQRVIIADQLNKAGLSKSDIIMTKEGVEIIVKKQPMRFTPEMINLNNSPAGKVVLEQMKRTPFGRITGPVQEIMKPEAPTEVTYIPPEQLRGVTEAPVRGIAAPPAQIAPKPEVPVKPEVPIPEVPVPEKGAVPEVPKFVRPVLSKVQQQQIAKLRIELSRLSNTLKETLIRTREQFTARDAIEVQKINEEMKKVRTQIQKVQQQVIREPEKIPIEKKVEAVSRFISPEIEIGVRPTMTPDEIRELRELQTSRTALKGKNLDRFIELKEKEALAAEPETKIEKSLKQRLEAKKPITRISEIPVIRYSQKGFELTDQYKGGTWYITPESKTFDFEKGYPKQAGGPIKIETNISIKNPLVIKDAMVEEGSFAVINKGYGNYLPVKEEELVNEFYQRTKETDISDKKYKEIIRDVLNKNGTPKEVIDTVIKSNRQLGDTVNDLIISKGLKKMGYDALILENEYKGNVIDRHIFKFAKKEVKPVTRKISISQKKEVIPEEKLQRIVELTTPQEKIYWKKLEGLKKNEATAEDLIKLELEEFNKEIDHPSGIDKSGIIRDFIQEKFKITGPLTEEGMKMQATLGLNLLSDSIHQMDLLWQKILGRKIHNAFGVAFDKLIPEKIKSGFVYGYGRPKEWLALQIQLGVERNQFARQIYKLTRRMSTLKPEEIKLIRPLIESGMFDIGSMDRQMLLKLMPPVSERGIQKPLPARTEEIIDIAREISDTFFYLGENLVRFNILKPEQFAKCAKVYYPYFYKIFNKDTNQFTYFFRKRLDLSYAKHRKDIPEEVREAMKLMDNTPEPVAKRMLQEAGDIALARMFLAASQIPNVASDIQTSEHTIQLAKTKRLGALSEKWVNKYVAQDLEGLLYIPEQVDRMFQTMWGIWKSSKIVWNPATVSHNIITNFWLADIAGNLPPEDIQTWVSAIKDTTDYFYKGKDVNSVQALVNQGVVGTEFWREEIYKTLDKWLEDNVKLEDKSIVSTFLRGVAKFDKYAGEFYNLSEVIAKVAVFKKNIELKFPVEEAAKLAENALFNYSKITPLIKQLRSGGGPGPLPKQITPIVAQPFITFRYKVYPLMVKSLVLKPFTWAKWFLLMSLVTTYAAQKLGKSKEEIQKMKERIGRRTGKFAIPTAKLEKTKTGEDEYFFLDFTYIFPGQDALEIWQTIKNQKPEDLIKAAQIGGSPLMNFMAAAITNKDPYFGTDLLSEFDTFGDAFWKYFHYTCNQLAPPVIGYGAERILNAVLQKPTRWGETEPVMTAIESSIFGLKQIPYIKSIEDQKTQIMLRHYEKEFYSQLYRIAGNMSLSDQEKIKKVEDLTKRYEFKINQEIKLSQ